MRVCVCLACDSNTLCRIAIQQKLATRQCPIPAILDLLYGRWRPLVARLLKNLQ